MKTIVLSVTAFFIFTISNSQTINETIDYINQTNHHHFENLFWSADLLGGNNGTAQFRNGNSYYVEGSKFFKTYHILNINKKGLLTINRVIDTYVIPDGTLIVDNIERDISKRKLQTTAEVINTYYFYLKELVDTVTIAHPPVSHSQRSTLDNWQIYYRPENYDYRIWLYCRDSCNCINYKNGDLPSNKIAISINSLIYAERVKNALEYLIKLAKSNPDYWEKDPFAN